MRLHRVAPVAVNAAGDATVLARQNAVLCTQPVCGNVRDTFGHGTVDPVRGGGAVCAGAAGLANAAIRATAVMTVVIPHHAPCQVPGQTLDQALAPPTSSAVHD